MRQQPSSVPCTCFHKLLEPSSRQTVFFSGTDVEVQSSSSSKTISAKIIGVDDCGYLRVRRHDDGSILTLHPDGNSFDLTKNLVAAKH